MGKGEVMDRSGKRDSLKEIGKTALRLIGRKDEGQSYTDYYRGLNEELKAHGPCLPCMLVDLDRLDKNIEALVAGLKINYRIVVKSLPSPEMVGYIMDKAKTNRLMVFHQPFLNHVAARFPESDVLMGKPLPVRAAKTFYEKHNASSGFDPAGQLQWLIDTEARLIEYQDLARELGVKMRISVEIDVGMHRGGLKSPSDLPPLLDRILADPDRLEFAGFMGYDPHVVKVPRIVMRTEEAYERSQEAYRGFIGLVRKKYPDIDPDSLCLNGAGSPTFSMHKKGTVCNDISAGSGLVKPADFDIPTLADFAPASYIATPVLKRIEGSALPTIEFLDEYARAFDPNMELSYFIYGGKWMARFEAPAGLRHNKLFGQSTNQEMVNGSKATALEVGDNIFLRPSQSEFVFLQFGGILTVRGGELSGLWPILKQEC